jgi:urease accessory protein
LPSSLHIQTGLRNGKTFLKNSFCNQPFKIADITEDRSADDLRLMLMSSSPGILDGDNYEMKIELQEKTALSVCTQSYQRLFQMREGAKQSFEVVMNPGSSFSYVPHPVVPHHGSSFVSENKIFMSAACSLVWSEIFTCGRKLNGESFSFSGYHNITSIFHGKKLVVKENLMIRPSLVKMDSIGQMEGFSHQASLIFIDENISVKGIVEDIRKSLLEEKGIAAAVTELPVNGLIIRMLGNKAEQLFDFVKRTSMALQEVRIINQKHAQVSYADRD